MQAIRALKAICLLMAILSGISVFAQTRSGDGALSLIPVDRVWYASDFGAEGNGLGLDTEAIQEAINMCAAAGGGRVRLTPGNYLCGTIFLKDNVTLYLDAGAVITGSANREDYEVIQRLNAKDEPMFGDHVTFLIFAEEAKNIGIEGRGEINGNGAAFWKKETFVFREDIVKRQLKDWRPRGMICFLNCRFVTVRDVLLSESPCYTLWPFGCDDVRIDGITILNPVDGQNTDGIDLDCCRRVTVSNCQVVGGDDAIALKSDGTKLGGFRPCENIVVTNCILSSPPACGIRIGYEGDSPIRNCTFSNLTIHHSHHGIDLISILPDADFPFTIKQGTRIENLQFGQIVMEDVIQPIYLWMGNEKPDLEPEVYMRNIRITGLTATGVGDSFIGSRTTRKVENIFLSDIHLSLDRHIAADVAYSHLWYIGENPYALYVSKVDGISIEGLSVDFTDASGFWKYAVYCEDSDEVTIDRLSTRNRGKVKLVSQVGLARSTLRIYNSESMEGLKLVTNEENADIRVGKEGDFRWPDGKQMGLSLTFDDARVSQIDKGIPLLDRYGLKATFYISPDNLQRRLNEWKNAICNGHEIGNHSVSHPCSGNFEWSRENALEDYSLDEMAQELDSANAFIRNMLGVQPASFAYPCGQKSVGRDSQTMSYVPLVASMFESGRGWLNEAPNDPVFCDLAQLNGVSLDGKSFDEILDLIEEARAAGNWLILAGHEMDEGPEAYQTSLLSTIEEICQYASDPDNGIWMEPVHNIASYLREQRGAPRFLASPPVMR